MNPSLPQPRNSLIPTLIVTASILATLVLVATTNLSDTSLLQATCGATLTLNKGGKNITTLTSGTYKIKVTLSTPTNVLHLHGPATNRATAPGQTHSAWLLNLAPGNYTLTCNNATKALTVTYR